MITRKRSKKAAAAAAVESGWDVARDFTTRISNWKPRTRFLLGLLGAFVAFVTIVLFTSEPDALKAGRTRLKLEP
jgi:hypothetical protein